MTGSSPEAANHTAESPHNSTVCAFRQPDLFHGVSQDGVASMGLGIHDLAACILFYRFRFAGHVFLEANVHFHRFLCSIIMHACVYVSKNNARVHS